MSKFIQNITKATGSVAVVALATTVFPMSASAVITVFTSQSSFQAAVAAPYGNYVETFDSLNPTASLATPQTFARGGFSYTASSAPNSSFFPAGTQGGDVWLSTNNRWDTITIDSFTGGNVSAVGGNFFGSDTNGQYDGTAATINVTATDASGSVLQSLVTIFRYG